MLEQQNKALLATIKLLTSTLSDLNKDNDLTNLIAYSNAVIKYYSPKN